MTTKTSLTIITTLTATFVALCAAIFSVTGISKLFAGAALTAGIMAAALELGKIVSISFLYQYWKEIPKTLKAYLSVAAVALMLITSAGIYGYLSSAYAKVAATPLKLNAEIQSMDMRKQTLDADIARKNTRLDQLISLRGQQENRLDSLVVRSQTGNTTTIRSAQNSLNASDKNVTALQKEISTMSTTRDSIGALGIDKQVQIDTDTEIGTFVYIARVLGISLDNLVKWFTLIIVLVFDPLAIALVISVNFLIKHRTVAKKEENNLEEWDIPMFDPLRDPIPINSDIIQPTPVPSKPYVEKAPEEVAPVAPESMSIYPAHDPEGPPDLQPSHTAEYAGVPEWMHHTFDWDDTSRWSHDPLAHEYKRRHIDGR